MGCCLGRTHVVHGLVPPSDVKRVGSLLLRGPTADVTASVLVLPSDQERRVTVVAKETCCGLSSYGFHVDPADQAHTVLAFGSCCGASWWTDAEPLPAVL
jgi:hypothetical protein